MDILWSNIFRKKNAGHNGMLDILKEVPIFRDLNDRELRKIERLIYVRSFRKDETIFRQGEPGLGMYIIESGRVLILLPSHPDPIAELSEGEFFGELSLLDDAPRSASAIASEDTKLLCFFHPELMDLLNVDPKLGLKLLIGLARTIGERTKKAAEYIDLLKNNPDFREEDRADARQRITDLA